MNPDLIFIIIFYGGWIGVFIYLYYIMNRPKCVGPDTFIPPPPLCNEPSINTPTNMRTMKQWEKSGKDLSDFLVPGDKITEELYNFIGECISPTYCTGNLIQGGDAQYEEDGVDFYMTATCVTTIDQVKYVYLGILPEFKQ